MWTWDHASVAFFSRPLFFVVASCVLASHRNCTKWLSVFWWLAEMQFSLLGVAVGVAIVQRDGASLCFAVWCHIRKSTVAPGRHRGGPL